MRIEYQLTIWYGTADSCVEHLVFPLGPKYVFVLFRLRIAGDLHNSLDDRRAKTFFPTNGQIGLNRRIIVLDLIIIYSAKY